MPSINSPVPSEASVPKAASEIVPPAETTRSPRFVPINVSAVASLSPSPDCAASFVEIAPRTIAVLSSIVMSSPVAFNASPERSASKSCVSGVSSAISKNSPADPAVSDVAPVTEIAAEVSVKLPACAVASKKPSAVTSPSCNASASVTVTSKPRAFTGPANRFA